MERMGTFYSIVSFSCKKATDKRIEAILNNNKKLRREEKMR